jgi:maleate isomerase
MSGWRARIGHIDASPAVEEEWRRPAPAGVSFVRVEMPGDTEAALVEADVVVHCGTFAALGRAAELCDRIEGALGVPAVTALGSGVLALRELGAQHIVIASDHTDEQNDTLATYLEELGFAVLGWQGIEDVDEANAFYRLGRTLVSSVPGADALLLSCEWSATLELIEALQWDTGLEVVSTSQAALWNALRTAGVGEPVRGFGRLLERPRLP